VDLSLSKFETNLAARRIPTSPRLLNKKRAAVAAVLRFDRGAPDVLLMTRATRRDDRWSGQVCFPGGKEAKGDRSLVDTAMRETREELGIDLESSGRMIGRLNNVRALARLRVRPMKISPFIFVQTAPMDVVLGDEATNHFWLPLDRAAAGEFDSEYEYQVGPVPMQFPCWRYEGHVVWGLTYRMLRELLRKVEH
jgi:8-oxo-dGTP pyrophosphatase MutT (NUDIX family)